MKNLEFRGNGTFRICQVTDLHLYALVEPEKLDMTLQLIHKAIKMTQPDLVVITGDIAWGKGTQKSLDILKNFFMDEKVVWAPVLGNHDGNHNDSDIASRKAFAEQLVGMPYSLFEMGPPEIGGYGNYCVTINGSDSTPRWILYFLDFNGEYYPEQMNWYRATSKGFADRHNELAFLHVPLPEYVEVWDYEATKGMNEERVSTTDLNAGLFAAMVSAGSMRGVFAGHDHINDFEGSLHGIRLCYGRGTGYQAYGLESYRRGARIIDIRQDSDDFDTQIFLDDGELYHQTRINKPRFNRK